jgi:hypothetical protein
VKFILQQKQTERYISSHNFVSDVTKELPDIIFVNMFCFPQKQKKKIWRNPSLPATECKAAHTDNTVLWNKFSVTQFLSFKPFISIQIPWLELTDSNCNLSESSLFHR